MKRTRIINLIALFVNLAIFAGFFAGFYFRFLKPILPDFKKIGELGTEILGELRYFEFIAAIITMLASLFMMFANGKSIRRMRDSTPGWIFTFRYLSMGASILMVVSTFISMGLNKGSIKDLAQYFNFTNYVFYWYIAMPILSILLLLFLELEPKCRFRKNFGPLILWIVYSAGVLVFMFILIPKKGVEYVANDFCPYFIFLLTKDLIAAKQNVELNQTITISMFVIFTALSFVLPILLRLLNRALSSLIIGYEYVEIDGEGNPIKTVKKHKAIGHHKNSDETVGVRTYRGNVFHVSVNDRKLRNWKVILPNKSSKVFATQQEAITFATNKAKRSKGTVKVHTALGKLKFENQ